RTLRGPAVRGRVVARPRGRQAVRRRAGDARPARCEYTPHVVIVPAGKDLSILNSDGVLHNIHTSSLRPEAAANPPVNRAQPKFKTSMTETFRAAETLRVS